MKSAGLVNETRTKCFSRQLIILDYNILPTTLALREREFKVLPD